MAEQSGAPEKRDFKTGQSKKADAPATKPEDAASPKEAPEKAEAPAQDQEKKEAREKVEALEKRIQELEKRNGRMKWTVAASAAALAGAVIAIVCAATLNTPAPPPKIILAEGIQLSDPHGRFRAEIGESESGWGLCLYDRDAGKGQTDSSVIPPPRIEIRLGEADNRIIIRGAGKQKSAVDLGINKLGWPSVTLFDRETATPRAALGETEVPSDGKLEKRASDSLVLSDKMGKPVWKAGETDTDFAPAPASTPAK